MLNPSVHKYVAIHPLFGNIMLKKTDLYKELPDLFVITIILLPMSQTCYNPYFGTKKKFKAAFYV